MLAALRTPEELAHYSLASRMGGVVNLVAVQPLNLAWMPLLFRLREDQRPEVLRILVPYLVIGFGAIVIAISAGVGPLLSWMGSEPSYARGVPLVPWIAFGYAAFGLVVITTGVLALYQRTAAVSLWIVLAALANLAMNFVLVPFHGAMGSAVASLLAYAGLAVVHFRLVRNLIPVRYPWGRIAGVAIASAAAAFVASFRPYTGSAADWGLRAGAVAAWAAALYVTRWFTPAEAREIVRVLRQRST
ncbi:MAG: polysaccharide biosynthesis C-terminal domain-containing protein [Candidatus Eisenbacteria bacterium]|nr:polysaccharide biosynthesis C-terminal domain-containing protein [Candidatus Eisenbacteria bacterium]